MNSVVIFQWSLLNCSRGETRQQVIETHEFTVYLHFSTVFKICLIVRHSSGLISFHCLPEATMCCYVILYTLKGCCYDSEIQTKRFHLRVMLQKDTNQIANS